MPSILPNFYLILIGVIIATSFSQFIYMLNSKKPLINALMILLGISSSLFLFNSITLHSLTDTSDIYNIAKTNVGYYLLEMLILLIILYIYQGKKLKIAFYIPLTIILITFILNIVYPNGVIFSEITEIKTLNIKWVGHYVKIHGKTNWFYAILSILFYLSVLNFMIMSVFRLRKEERVSKAKLFLVFSILFVITNIYDVCIDLDFINGIYLTEVLIVPILLLLNFDFYFEMKKRKRIELLLQKSERNFQKMINKVQLIVVGISTQGNINYVNPYFEQLTKYTSDELLGKEFVEIFIPPEQKAEIIKVMSSLLKGEDFFSYVNPILTKDKTILHIAWSNVLIKTKEGNIDEILCIGANISERIYNRIELEKAYNEIKSIKEKLEDENTYLKESLKPQLSDKSLMVGTSDVMKYLQNSIKEVAKSETTVLIEGETGVGKELVAKAILNNSSRSNKPFISVNCAALPKELIESELFGHEKGSFTSADSKRIGHFESANGGTLFLDEIGELPIILQPKLLRVLQEGEFTRLGGHKPIKVDVRIIAATNKSLKEMVNSGLFRGDLFYRISVFPLTVPPLRDRKEDIPVLVKGFVKEIGHKEGKGDLKISVSTIKKLQNYSWPGNIRELRNVIERSVITSKNHKLILRDSLDEKTNTKLSNNLSLQDVEKNHIIHVLNGCNWKISGENGAASILKVNESTLRSRMKKLEIKRPD